MPYEINFLGTYDAESLIAELKRISTVSGKPTVTSSDIDKLGRVSYATILHRFGSMRAANEAAGLVPRAIRYWTDEELLDAVLSLWDTTLREEGRRPRGADAKKYGMPVHPHTVAARFGTWNKALLAANELADRRWKTRPPKAPGERTSLSVRTRYQVFKRDLYRCCICAKTGVELEVDHIVPVARGGSDDMDNLQTLCVPCNRGKRDSLQ
jgi:5-methylcytosine-specific restriction endonuclease McrA